MPNSPAELFYVPLWEKEILEDAAERLGFLKTTGKPSKSMMYREKIRIQLIQADEVSREKYRRFLPSDEFKRLSSRRGSRNA